MLQPARAGGEDTRINGAVGLVRAGEVAAAHQELAGDLAAGEGESFFEQLDPGGFILRRLRVQPGAETAVRCLQALDGARVLDGRVDFQAVADDAGVGEQAGNVGLVIGGDGGNIEVVIGAAQVVRLAQDGAPAQPRLIDFKDKALKQAVVVVNGEAVLVVVIVAVRVVRRQGGDVSAVAHGSRRLRKSAKWRQSSASSSAW